MALENIFKALRISEKSAISLDKMEENYILDIGCQKEVGEDCLLAATSSNKTIRLFKRSNLAATGVCKGHRDMVTGLSWGQKDCNMLYTSSTDKTVRAWDIRIKVDKEVQRFEGADESDNLFSCVDINAADQVVCAGLEKDSNDDAFIFFWDTRNTKLLGCYSESHQDDITQVCFHPENPDSLSSSSIDGLVCIYDVSQTDEDDAILYCFNSLSAVGKISWCGPDLQNICSTTLIDTVHVWDTKEGDPVLEIPELKESLVGQNRIDYVVDCLQYSDDKTLTLLAGDHNGEMKVIEYSAGTEGSEGQPKVIQTLCEGHKSTVRCCHWDSQTHTLVTGAEDSMLTLWSCKQAEVTKSQTVKSKTKKAKKRSVPY